jgi:hypothetical protein
MVERLKIKVAATAIGTAGAMVASRAVATAPRIAAVGPCAQLARIQNPPCCTDRSFGSEEWRV